jgi:hypothetical protein
MKKSAVKGTKTELSAEERRRERQRLYHKKYNAVRREKYQSDPAYRARVIERERERYREVTGHEPRGFGQDAGRAKEFATGKKMWTEDDAIITVATLSVDEMARFLGTTSKILSEWIRTEKFPEPNKRSKCGKRVFTIREANALAEVLRKGLRGRSAFRPTDTEVMEELHAVYDGLQ